MTEPHDSLARLSSADRELFEQLMLVALSEASVAASEGEVPVGAVVARGTQILARDHNRMRQLGCHTAHAELLAINAAMRECSVDSSGNSDRDSDRDSDSYLSQLTLVVTLEPCAMCAGAIVLSRVGRLVFGAWDDKAGMCGSVGDIVRHPRLNHRPEVVGGVLGGESSVLLREFFELRR